MAKKPIKFDDLVDYALVTDVTSYNDLLEIGPAPEELALGVPVSEEDSNDSEEDYLPGAFLTDVTYFDDSNDSEDSGEFEATDEGLGI